MEKVASDLGHRVLGELQSMSVGVGIILVEGLGCIKER